jgi:hypothetical protein
MRASRDVAFHTSNFTFHISNKAGIRPVRRRIAMINLPFAMMSIDHSKRLASLLDSHAFDVVIATAVSSDGLPSIHHEKCGYFAADRR